MNPSLENSTSPIDNSTSPSDERKQSPPAFLDLADSAARLGSNMSDISARVELKRLEHERQRALQRKMFEDQMRALEQQQAQELLNLPLDPSSPNGATGIQHLAVSAPTTPPRLNATLHGDVQSAGRHGHSHLVDADTLSKAVGAADKRKSVTYAPSVNLSPDMATGPSPNNPSFARPAGAKSMPASRRTSASSNDDELVGHLQNLALGDGHRSRGASPAPASVSASILNRRYADDEGARYASTYNAGMMLDEQLDQEMHNAMRHLPTSDEDKYTSAYANKVSTSSAALDLAHRPLESREKSSEWPHYNRGPDGLASRSDRRAVTNPTLNLSDEVPGSKLPSAVSASSTPLIAQHPQSITHVQTPSSRRGSPPNLLDGFNATTRSVPATPLGIPANPSHLLKTPGTPLTESQALNGRLSAHGLPDSSVNAGDLQASLSRLGSNRFENGSLAYGSGLEDSQYNTDSSYGMNGNLDNGRYNNYGFESNGRTSVAGNTSGSTALYHHNGSRYGLGLPGRATVGVDSKMNGLHGPKHKRGDMDLNRFAGTRLEDLQGEIPALCKDQHGCRYLQKKLEEGVPEHRDMIFRETFGHFADLMTDPFGNYLCQKLLEYSTDDQRNVICESVAQDLTGKYTFRASSIITLTVETQADLRYNAQIHSIIVALSLHVVVLIKDLNGNHVIQKCLNKLSPEDNQFIYNAVAANCVEVATHRHGCCVLQRCIDHASDHQRIQLVNEITFNALTLVQDPYGNYVVQYILDLNDNRFSDAVIRQFTGNVCALSVQKFSSNVIEKCIRVAEHNTRKILIEELLNRTRLEKLLRDSYGNYCVQTALDYAEPTQRALLVEGIRPVLPLIRNTPYGKRIQNKLQREHLDQFGSYHSQQALVNMALTNQGLAGVPQGAGRHLHQGNPMADVYGTQNGLYSLQSAPGSYGSPLTTQLHNLGPQGIDSYVLQGNSNHNQGLSPSHGNGFSAGSSFGGVNHFGGAAAIQLNDPYQRSTFGYGM
uniref:Putative ARM repeat-containing protein n=1 Tax=Moniliophthora roreri TaxID=221103 RepID=A0A0W0FA96_MONRR